MLHVCQPNHFFRSHFHSQRGNIAHANYSIPMEHFKSNFVSCIFNLRWKKNNFRKIRAVPTGRLYRMWLRLVEKKLITVALSRPWSTVRFQITLVRHPQTDPPEVHTLLDVRHNKRQADTQVCAVKQYDLVLCFQRWHPIFRIITNLFYSRDQQADSNVSVWLSLQWTLPVYHAT